MAREKSPFPAISGSIYDPADLRWSVPEPLFPYTRDWGRPAVDWRLVTDGIRQHGIRNAAQTTIAPTGTIGTVAGCEGYGCEPVFALAYIRHVNDHGKDLTLNYASPLFQAALDKADFDAEQKEQIISQVIEAGSCQQIALLPEEMRNVYVVSADISAHEHIRLQAALQRFVDNSLSKTINFPAGTTEQEVAEAFLEAWKLGCKGITVYITGSRDKVVLETKATMQAKQAAVEEKATPVPDTLVSQPAFWKDTKKPRPRILKGYTYSIETPLGKAFITINENGGDQPFEVFINTAKAGSETAAHSEALGRLISYVLRIASSIEPRERLKVVMEQLAGIGGGRSLGFGPNRVRSLPDGIAKALDEYLYQQHWEKEEEPEPLPGEPLPFLDDKKEVRPIGELCPECGQATLINEEGCRKCYTCGHSEC